jgi:uncharacterized OB-fold protein
MEIPRYWRERKQRYSLVGETCPVCNSQVFPPREVCPYCSEAKRKSEGLDSRVAVERQAVMTFPARVEAIK